LKQKPEQDWLAPVRAQAIDMMMAAIREDLAALNVVHDVFFSERALVAGPSDEVAATIAALRAADKIYEGRLAPPKGAPIEDWEDREQTLFRATAFGDDVDRPLMKSDGSYTYFASTSRTTIEVRPRLREMIDVWGADHGGYIKRMQAASSRSAAARPISTSRSCSWCGCFGRRSGQNVEAVRGLRHIA
jgi:arginyl-tRNA synthetase